MSRSLLAPLALLALAVLAACSRPAGETQVAPGLTPARVLRVVDGDTIVVLIGGREERVRYIGIDTPETVDPRRPEECFGREASRRNRELVEGKTVGLERDVSDRDRYGRLLRYVWVGDMLVNARLVEEGYAEAVAYPPDLKYADLLAALEAEARAAGRGLWGACATPSPGAGASRRDLTILGSAAVPPGWPGRSSMWMGPGLAFAGQSGLGL